MAADIALAGDAALHDPLTRKLSRLVVLSPAEIDVLSELQSHGRRVARGREMVVEGRKYDER
jgi:hypothetical protein